MKKNNRYNHKNNFQRARYAKVIEIDKETAMDQLIAILSALDADNDNRAEYTLAFSNFTDEEVMEFDKKMLQMLALHSKMRGFGYAINFDSFLPMAS